MALRCLTRRTYRRREPLESSKQIPLPSQSNLEWGASSYSRWGSDGLQCYRLLVLEHQNRERIERSGGRGVEVDMANMEIIVWFRADIPGSVAPTPERWNTARFVGRRRI